MNKLKAFGGFTLMELMIVVAIISILAAIAIPSYDNYVIRTKRGEAMAAVQAASQALERYRSNNGFSYGRASLTGGSGTVVFAKQVPVEGGTAYYNLRLFDAAGNDVTATRLPDGATAFRVEAQATGSMSGKDTSVSITNTGAKVWKDKSGTSHNCWPTSGGTC